MENKSRIELANALDEFVAENERPTAENLATLIKRYPQHEKELIEFAASWAQQLLLPPEDELGPETEKSLIDRTMSHMLNIAYQNEKSGLAGVQQEQPIQSLTDEARRLGMNAKDLAASCDLDVLLVTKLNSRQIDPLTIPVLLIQNLGDRLSRSFETIASYLQLPQAAVSKKAFLSRSKPSRVEQQSFPDAIRASSLPGPDKERWLAEASKEE
ncbi:hypothetical protein [Hyphococcus sp.]|jgi:hypothetical protein|uniref:hypothetical protein n=1 Tax=Hyphococcus sp. TaxID=2038636 RepID=UPI003CCB90D7